MNRHVENIYRIWLKADYLDTVHGLSAYDVYHERAVKEADGYPVWTGPGVFSAISPNNDEEGTWRGLRDLVGTHRRGDPLSSVSVTTYPLNREKAWRILNGEHPLAVLSGAKTRAFFQCIMDPRDDQSVVVDGHVYSVWSGRRYRMDEAKISPRLYERIAGDYRALAGIVKLIPSQLQAITWLAWKRVNRIKYNPQLKLPF